MPTHAKRLSERDEEHGGVAFALTKSVDFAKLDAELTSEMGWRNLAGLIAEGDASEASEDNPVVVWVVRTDVDTNTFKRVVTAHDPAPQDTPWMRLLTKAQGDEDLTDDEVREAIKLLLVRSAGGLG
jgi:hypothetical protein